MKNKWRTIAVVCMVITFLIILFNIINYVSYEKETDKINECYYDICNDYPDADYLDDVCYCYDYDVLGELVVADTKYMR